MTPAMKSVATTEAEIFDFYPRRSRPTIQPFELPPVRTKTIEEMALNQTAFDRAFPPITTTNSDLLILNWDEIERQYLDLVAHWEVQNAAFQIREARRMASMESPEKTIRCLMVLAHSCPGLDDEKPPCGTGKYIPMP